MCRSRITGFYEATSGKVLYAGEDVTDLPVHERASRGMGRTFQNVGLVKGSTVGENLKSAQHLQVRYGALGALFGSTKASEIEKEAEARARRILDLVDLGHLWDTRIAGLPHGIQKRLEIAAVLATDPEVLCEGQPDDVRNHPDVVRAYLGLEPDEVA